MAAETVAAAILAKYVGTYVEQPPLWRAVPRVVEISIADGHLVGDMDGRGKVPLIATSEIRGDAGEIAAGCGRGGKTADRQQALVVEDDVEMGARIGRGCGARSVGP